MDNKQFELYNNIPQSEFSFADKGGKKHDKKLDTKPMSFLQDAFNRFRKNKGSVFAAIIIIILIIYSIVGPYCCSKAYRDSYATNTHVLQYAYLKPKLFKTGTGFWDGTNKKELSQAAYGRLVAMEIETGYTIIVKESSFIYEDPVDKSTSTMHNVKYDTYTSLGMFELTVTYDEYLKMQEWQNDNGIQLIYPIVDGTLAKAYATGSKDKNIWYICNEKGVSPTKNANGEPIFNAAYKLTGEDGNYSSLRISGDPGINDINAADRYRYATISGSSQTGYSYNLRINKYAYFQYQYDIEPSFIFGTNSKGYDIFTRLASGARFSFILAIVVSAVNLTIGTIYGAIEGYYGGATDMIMERVSDILSGIPSMVVTVLFQLHLSGKVGSVVALVYAFVLTGWIGMASSVRMQFYRFKNQEYVLAARTLGAKDSRIMFKHIFPNSLGTIITGTVLVIPGVIFSETSLTYLGIINLDSPTMSSVGSMLADGQADLTKYPHCILFPALFIALLMICFNLFGNGLRDAFNPSLRGSEE